ncbi:MYG1 protein-like [Gordionus sp. m RMFG-2023]|uniref:MYG1 protein-like n=1 Tax=Gordionus sp. m RMFG-2023 TaxID=3053472 RepID=UPI0031FD0EAC
MVKLYEKIGTHDGKFHCDEVLACYLLKCLPEFKSAYIIRSRDTQLLEKCDVVVDVGGVYDYDKLRFDHHQKSFDKTLQSIKDNALFDKIKLSSAGLVYAHFGEKVIRESLKRCSSSHSTTNLNESLISYIYLKVYENFIQEIDAIDNGIDVTETNEIKKYKISTNLSSRVSHLNPAWNDLTTPADAQFQKAINLVGPEFDERIHFYANVMWPAREIVKKAIEDRFKVYESGEILVLDISVPWQDTLYEIEKEQKIYPLIKFVVFGTRTSPNITGDRGEDWRVQCVSTQPGSFHNRLSLPQTWRGLRGIELSKISGIENCVFVHMSGFIGGNKTKEGAIDMAITTLIEDHSP